MNILDKAIFAVMPVYGVKRMAARRAAEVIRNYEAAAKNRRTSHWGHSSGSANAEIELSIESLRNVSRSMVRNNTYAFQAINTLATNVVGTGIRPNITVLGENEPLLNKVKKYWKDWAEKTECDFYRSLNFYGIQELSARGMFESGECLIVRRKMQSREGGVLPMKLQILEADFLDTHKTTDKIGSGNYITNGIEYNAKGQRVAYWLFSEHPGNRTGYYSVSERYLESDVIHLYRQLRPGQERGVPAGVSAFVRLNDFDDYENAELMRQKIASCYVAFVHGGTDGLPGVEDPTDPKEPRTKLAPGIIEHIDAGKQVTLSSPPTTNGQDGFSRQTLRGAAAGYELTYEQLSGDLSNVNFSSGRMGNIEQSKKTVNIQLNVFIPKVCERVFAWFLEAVFLKESLAINQITCDWTAPRREMIDVTKETQAIIDQILAGITSWDEAVREQGWNADDLALSIQKSQERFKKLGITVLSDASNPAATMSGNNKQVKPVNNDGKNAGNTGGSTD
jgi:lambda family phage portal protein